jgi:hypothetical protein
MPGSPTSPAAGPAETQNTNIPDGTTMRWVDGSTLVALQMDSGQRGWIYRDEVNGFMYNLCVEAGNCAAGWPIWNPPVSQEVYCEWAGGRVLTAEELTQVLDNGLFTSVLDNGFSPASVLDNGLLVSVLDNGFLPNDFSMQFRCAVEDPTPQPEFCQAPAFYENGMPEEMGEEAAKAGEFCQNGLGFVTFDLTLPENASIESFSSDCQSVGGNRIACSGEPGASAGEAWVSILCDMMDAQFGCQAGFELSSSSGASCLFNGEGIGAQSAPHLAVVDVNGFFDPPPGGCSIGYYYDPARGVCVAAGSPPASPPAECLDGFEMDTGRNCCVSNLPSGNYPGCPPGVAIDPVTGACDFERIWQDNDTALEKIDLSMTFPACSSGGNSGSEGVCPAGQTWTCGDPNDPKSCYCK